MPEVRYEESDHGPSLISDAIRVDVHANKGTLDIRALGASDSEITDASISVLLADGPAFTTRGAGFGEAGAMPVEDDPHGRGLAVVLDRARDAEEPDISITITLYEDRPFAVIQAEVKNTTGAALRVAAFHVLEDARVDLGSPPAQWRLYKEGWQNWSPTLVMPVSGEDIYFAPPVIGPITQAEQQPGRFVSELVTAVTDPGSDRSVVAGFVSTADQFSEVWLDRGPQTVTAASYADGVEVAPTQTLASERLLVDLSPEPLAGLAGYGEALGREMQAPVWPRPVQGWCSWYYYYQGITEENLLENLEYLAQHRDELPVEYFQIDDGYQAEIGDWLTPNEKFPRGVAFLSEEAHKRGFKAGLWVAPFMVSANSRLYQEHPDWVVQYRPGKPYVAMFNWNQDCYGLDLTRPEAIERVREVFRTVFDEWGFDYVKIDFLYAGALDGIRQDPNVTRAQAYRRGIEAIREIAGERFILGCGHPIGPSIGIVNGSRIGSDVTPFWYSVYQPREKDRTELSYPSVINSIRSVIGRHWMHNRIWLNDPDCMLARDSDTALNLAELRTLASVISLSGGMWLNSDRLTRLSEPAREMLSMMLPVEGGGALPEDLFHSELAQRLRLECGSHTVLGVFNWRDEPVEVTTELPAGERHVFEAWEQKYLGVRSGSIALPLAAHGCAHLRLTPAGASPQVVGTSFHLLQGRMEIADEEWDGDTLRIGLRPVARKDGELFVWAPDGLRPRDEEGIRRTGDGLWAVATRVDSERRLAIKFA